MRICHIISGDLWAGAETMGYRLMKELLNRNDMELSAVLLNQGKLSESLRKIRIPVEIVEEENNNIFQLIRKIRSIIRETSPDIIHSHGFKENIIAYFSCKYKKNIPLVCTQHGLPEPVHKKYKYLKKYILSSYEKFVLSRHFKNIVAVSNDVRKYYLFDCMINPGKIVLIHNGTDVPYKPESMSSKKRFVIGSAGRLFPVKDYPFMVEVANEILHQADDIRFELAGEGPEKEKILALIRKYRIDGAFTLTGFLDDMTLAYKGWNLFINTSIHEGIPMSILEAMAHGIPVVAPNVGGLKEILNNGLEGCLVDGRNPQEFAKKCLDLYRNEDLRRKTGELARDKVIQEFSVTKMAKKYHDLYSRIRYNQV